MSRYEELGRIIKKRRLELKYTQGEVAHMLGVSRPYVARMETEGYGLDSVYTRRQLITILGLSPVLLGLAPDDKPTARYIDVEVARHTLHVHREAYFSGGNVGGVEGVRLMIGHLQEFQQNKEIQEVLAQYGMLGLDIAREAYDWQAIREFSDLSLTIIKDLHNPLLEATCRIRLADAYYEHYKFQEANQIISQVKLPDTLPRAALSSVYLCIARTAAAEKKNYWNALDKGLTIARKANDKDDTGWIKPTVEFAHLQAAQAHAHARDPELHDALDIAMHTDARYTRRLAILDTLAARAALLDKQPELAAGALEAALQKAVSIRSMPTLVFIAEIVHALSLTSYGRTIEAKKLKLQCDAALEQFHLTLPAGVFKQP
uniref:HTH cro/C1-type domain-containing protein n=1 Tax=Thermosporothrix sp. COM3 TaxID=2490863 RepID=A0A455SH31_9CHLR|nr:hypothetical protein KTC_25180 [Thermosporothrix sp. COM3]